MKGHHGWVPSPRRHVVQVDDCGSLGDSLEKIQVGDAFTNSWHMVGIFLTTRNADFFPFGSCFFDQITG